MILIVLALWIRSRGSRPKLSRVLLIVGISIPMIAANNGFANLVIRQLEGQYPIAYQMVSSTPPPPLEYVAVLGGGHYDNDELTYLSQLGDSSLARIAEGVRIAVRNPSAVLILCGYPGTDEIASHPSVLSGAAIELGITSDRIVMISDVHDTHDEIWALKKLVGSKQGGLVTSAWHMPRAMGMSRKVGLNVLACPADFTARNRKSSWSGWSKFGIDALEDTSIATRELLGLTWTKLRGQR
jgi:uncharacterized SAM-binding protein YcdF (DUF218 family)